MLVLTAVHLTATSDLNILMGMPFLCKISSLCLVGVILIMRIIQQKDLVCLQEDNERDDDDSEEILTAAHALTQAVTLTVTVKSNIHNIYY